jgi:hypothetical protein
VRPKPPRSPPHRAGRRLGALHLTAEWCLYSLRRAFADRVEGGRGTAVHLVDIST